MTLYDVIGVAPTATHEVIRAAYRKRARSLHPDLQAGRDNASMRGLNDAWHVLGNAESRRVYDATMQRESTTRSRPTPTPASKVRDEVDADVGWRGLSPLALLLAHYVKVLTLVALGSLIVALLFGLFADANGQGP